ncbi:AbrB/MazE/SpoVT family DNA-binding domain-containing protein [Gloeocapsa sp. PCC 73106]|uniref:AbrB/MazE/SpoVT family DNA-binding domain-containing protein n=1 Tax=Gloeocapsa sp. PCC 73106 TaxID=102232 RepID=UPI0002AC2189|nr:AbrB/MazE/SpoVT family DNA-binding domain-containing protein [Gloeocapsa sp. PCC 73106]ELR99665.1 growth regulator [Gloeocapsa sp. PCC 73106]
MTTQKLTKWGNSLGIRLPQEIIKQLGWKEGQDLRKPTTYSVALEKQPPPKKSTNSGPK